jgi:protein PhnA
MLTAAKWALSIVPAGIALGALLGAAVDPDMKDAPVPWWRLTGAEPVAQADPGPEYWPQDFAAGPSYRPDLDYDAEVWALPIPADEVWALPIPADEVWAFAQESIPLPPERSAAEEVADEAEATAHDALAAAAASEPAPPPAAASRPVLGCLASAARLCHGRSIWRGKRIMTGDDDEYVYDEDSGEWMPASELAAKQAAESAVEVRDAVGNLLADGDQVTLIKDLTVKGAGQTLKQGTLIKSIRLTGDPQEIDCRYEGIKGLVLRAEFVRKR